jgi:glycine dehydrogenase
LVGAPLMTSGAALASQLYTTLTEPVSYPAGVDRRAKYWPPVRRIDQAYGDRNLMCACPPPEAFAS